MTKRCGLVIFVRHGQTNFNFERRFQGQLDVPLNETGKRQAERAGKFLAEMFDPTPGKRGLLLQKISSSDLKRAHETALAIFAEMAGKHDPQIQARKLIVERTPLLREIHVGLFEGHTFAEFEKKHPRDCKEYMSQYEKDPSGTAYPCGESAEDVARRMLEFYEMNNREAIANDALEHAWHNRPMWKNLPAEIIVGHGAALGILLAEILGSSLPKKPELLKLGNADCLVLGHFKNGAKILQHAKVE